MQQLTSMGSDERQAQYGGVRSLSVRELKLHRRRLAADLGMLLPRSPARGPVEFQLAAIDLEISCRRYLEATYPAVPGSVRLSRHAVERYMANCLRAESRVDSVYLAVSELATNAVIHSASANVGTFTMRCELHFDFIWVEVEDAGGLWRVRDIRPDDYLHGLEIIDSLCDAWSADDIQSGRVVWARFNLR